MTHIDIPKPEDASTHQLVRRLCNTQGCVGSRLAVLILPNGTTHNLCEAHLAKACRAIGLTREQVMP